MDITGLISSFRTSSTYTVTRTARTSPIRGRAQSGSETTFTITASVSPATGNDLKRLPEGRRTNETLNLYTSTALLVGGQGVAYEADSVSISGQDFEVEHVATWRDPITGNLGYACLVQAVR